MEWAQQVQKVPWCALAAAAGLMRWCYQAQGV